MATSRSIEVRSVRWKAWEGKLYRFADGSGTFWIIVPLREFVGGPATEQEVDSYLGGATDKARGLAAEFTVPDYMAGYRGTATYARGIIDAVTGVPPSATTPLYTAGYQYKPRPTGKPSGGRSGGTYGGPRFY